jgi:hypothetical protein
LTVSSRDGGFLIAFLAWFVGVAGSAFWDLLSNVIFLYRASEAQKDAFYHQQQMSLRVGASDVNTLWSFWKLGRQWRHLAENSWSRSWPVTFAALVNVISFSAAGILVSKVTQTRPDVLLKPTVCGLWDDPWAGDTAPNLVEAGSYLTQLQQVLNLAGGYASSCYTFNTSQNEQKNCLAYGRSTFIWNITADVQCPFAPEMCRQGKSILLDSGFIDSHSHLGINSQAKDRIQYRQQYHCSPLETEGYVFRTSNASDPRIPSSGFGTSVFGTTISPQTPVLAPSGAEFVGFEYGLNQLNPFPNAGGASATNVTYVYNNYTFGLPGTDVAPNSYLFE